MVLEHLPDPATALTSMVAALRPGGWLLAASLVTVEEIDRHPIELTEKCLDLTAFPVVSVWGRKATHAPAGTAMVLAREHDETDSVQPTGPEPTARRSDSQVRG